MQRSAFIRLAGPIFVLAMLGCGHHKKSSIGQAAKITYPLSSISLNPGEVYSIIPSAVDVTDTNGNTIPNPTLTFTSSDSTVVTVTSAGAVCGGVFDSSNVVCQVKTVPAQTNVVISYGVASLAIPVYVHAPIKSLGVSAGAIATSGGTAVSGASCVSQTGTQQFSVAATSSSGTDITSTVGPPTWTTTNTAIATVNSSGLVTSLMPGATYVNASIGSVSVLSGAPALFIACPPQKISLHVSSATDTTFSLAPAATAQLAADVTDTLGQPITGAPLTWTSFHPASAVVSSSGLVTASAAGTTSIVASCTPPGCNSAPSGAVNSQGTGVGYPIYSNLMTGAVSGTSSSTVYATGAANPDGSSNTSMIPIDTTTHTAGTAITLNYPPNSMLFDRQGTYAYLGSSSGLMVFSTSTNTVANVFSSLTGTVLAVSNDGNKVAVFDNSANKLFICTGCSGSSATAETFSASGVTGGDFSGDGFKAYFPFTTSTTSGTYVYQPGAALHTLTSVSGNDVKFLPHESIGYIAGASFTGLATCNNASVDTKAATANILAVANDGSHLIGASGSGWADLAPSVTSGVCPPAISSTLKTATVPSFVGAPTQIIVTPDASMAFMTGYTLASGATGGGIPYYNTQTGASGIFAGGPAQGGQAFSGGITLDGKSLYVGVGAAGTNAPAVYLIDLTASTPSGAAPLVTTTFVPTIVTVRPK